MTAIPLPPGMPLPPAQAAKQVVMCDTECYIDYWLCMFESGEYFEAYPGQPLDRYGLAAVLRKYQIVTFNGMNYDMPLITLALEGYAPDQIKLASDRIIVGGVPGYQIAQAPDWIDHIDLFNVAPGQASLKMYGGKMHSKTLQDLPIKPDANISPEQRQILREYCRNDFRTTRDLYDAMKSQLALRVDIGAEFGIDVRSKSDPQIAEAVMKKLLPFKVERPYIEPGSMFYYRPPPWMSFTTPLLQSVFARMTSEPYFVNINGGVSPSYANTLVDWGDTQVRPGPHGDWVKRPEHWKHEIVHIGSTDYNLGIGGLHSQESCVVHVTDETYELNDDDVVSYYPSAILITGIYPQQIGPIFVDIYGDWYNRRLAAKAAGIKKTANSLKTFLNGVFGKLGNMWSIFFAPAELIQVTVTGQLALLMLIEMLELCGVQVVSANTDGIVTKCHRSLTAIRDDVIRHWAMTTGFKTERNAYRMLASRDVNNYVAVYADGTTKLKGAYAPPEPGPSGWPNPTGQIATDAVVAYITKGVPLEQTIYACTDIRKFVHVRQVKGGGSYCPNGTVPAKTTQIDMRSKVGDLPKDQLLVAYAKYVEQRATERVYLGKAVRWYYVKGSKGCIVTPAGGLVARSDGCRPVMTLPDVLPSDVDFDWYVTEARSMLADLGIKA